MTGTEKVELVFASCVEEDFLMGELHVGGQLVCIVLKRSEEGPVRLAFYDPESREERLADPEEFIAAIRSSVEEIRALPAS